MALSCMFCSQRFVSVQTLSKHINCTHEIKNLSKFQCGQGIPKCLRTFSNYKSLINHIRKIHINLLSENNFETPSHAVNNEESPNDLSSHPEADNGEISSTIQYQGMNKTDDLSYVVALFSETNLQRNNIQFILDMTRDLVDQKLGFESKSFQGLETEHLRIKRLKHENLWVEPREFVLNYEEQVKGEGIHYAALTGHGLKLTELIRSVFSVPSLLRAALKYMAKPRISQYITDCKDGTIFGDSSNRTIPYLIFYDEVEFGNPLGSHKGIQKLGVIYISFRCFEPYSYGSLDGIYPYMLFPSVGKPYMNKILEIIRDDIICLKEGLKFENTLLHFKLIGISGDNLGQHQLLGYVESFTANFPCIYCKIHKNSLKNAVVEDQSILRNEENYNKDLEANDVSVTGINRRCPLNDLEGFHCTQNILFDAMHDLLEGVLKYGMIEVLLHITKKQYITLETINLVFDAVDFSKFGLNKPPLLKENFLSKGDIAFSAAEMRNFVFIFSVVVGDQIPAEDPVWDYYLVLRRMTNLLLQKKLSKSEIEIIPKLVKLHNQSFLNLFQKNLKPKFHHLLHYCQTILKAGPLPMYWSMRFESFNRRLKEYANVIKSRVNLPYSLLIRSNYRIAHTLLKLRSVSDIETLAQSVGPVLSRENKITYKWATVRGNTFKVGSITFSPQTSSGLPIFCSVTEIFGNEEGLCAEITPLHTMSFNSHLDAYVVSVRLMKSSETVRLECLESPLVYILRGSEIYVPALGSYIEHMYSHI